MLRIFGVIGADAHHSRGIEQVGAMATALAPEGAATLDPFRSETLSLCVAWIAASHGPQWGMTWNEQRDLGLIFSGDDFDVAAKAREYRHAGNRLADNIHVLLRLYDEHGLGFLEQLEGAYAGILVDLRAGCAHLFNDRYGLARIYHCTTEKGIYFASEAKSLLAVLPTARELDARGVAEFFSTGCALQNRTLYRDIMLLPGASLWTIRPDRDVEKRRYFDARTWEEQRPLEVEAYTKQLVEVFGSIMPRYLDGRERVGLSLTGGLDSRMVLAWSKSPPGRLPCYSFDGPYRECADVEIARTLARAAGQSHSVIPIARSFFSDFPQLAEGTVLASDGAMDVSGAVELYVNRYARTIAPVRLTGNYGSEILRRYVAFRPRAFDLSLFQPEFAALLRESEATYRQEAAGHRLSFIAFKQVPWFHYGRRAIEVAQVTPRSPFLDNQLVALAYRAPSELAQSVQPLLHLIAAARPDFAQIRTDRGVRSGRILALGALEQKWEDLATKAEYAYDYGMPSWLARIDHMLSPLRLERFFLGRQKFYHFRIWYRDELNAFVRSMLLSNSSHLGRFVREPAARKLVEAHLRGTENHTLTIHKLLTMEILQRVLARPAATVRAGATSQ